MDSILKQKIIDKLTKFLNRAPHENEIQNGITDATLMNWIAQDDAVIQKADIEALKVKTKLVI